MKNDKVSIKLSLKTAWLSQILFFFLLYALYLFLYDYSQVRSSAPPKIPLMNLLFEGWVGWQLWNSDSSLHSCMRNEPWIHTRFSYEISTSSVSLNLMQFLLRILIHSMIFNLTRYRQVLVNYSLLIYACSNSDLNLTLVTGTTNGFIFQITNSLTESWGYAWPVLTVRSSFHFGSK